MTNAPSPTPLDSPAHATAADATPENAPLSASAQRLSEAARAFRAAAARPREPSDVANAFDHIEGALADLAAGAELAAYAVVQQANPDGAPATGAGAPPAARGVSWRLHGLGGKLVAARAVCLEVNRALRGYARV